MEKFNPRNIFDELVGPNPDLTTKRVASRWRVNKVPMDSDDRYILLLKRTIEVWQHIVPEDMVLRDIIENRINLFSSKDWEADDLAASRAFYDFSSNDAILNELDNPFKRKAGEVLLYFLPKLQFLREKLMVSMILLIPQYFKNLT